ncbi:hydroxymethylglutaryl-CoA lyase [Hydrogenibacillus schlegelii]|uniref:3-hydroxy-3-methylglutaryl-CoA lyase n=1 Tax=Hydrogenibacillus schlegelii TaxID=1484 RepID=A0A132MHG8_HYDSH|nr:hydroxymethylglutaryl-CoA lyase [Hydrogenibacillus schlegelii]KWW97205.1 3-hydroxy-3-methylglutaryl-CoA lyase [Hydrogenibacillus schlegelii]OAR05375.1 3-hydroxy-3-methylglutaryl-CoA lyase [Hydrogenibacillus schlegelii]
MIAIQEVGPRDGLQNEPVRLSTAEKIAFIERLAATGLRRIEAVSFVHPERVPQMADAEAVWAGFRRASGVTYAGLVLNRRGFERARTAGVEEIHFAFGVTETFNRKNQGAAPEASFRQFAALLEEAEAAGARGRFRATLTLSVAFGCPYEGPVDEGRVVDFVRRAAEAGFDEIVLADTIGVGVPTQAARLVRRAIEATGGRVPIGVHFHNTRNTGLANVYAALEAGATVFDASVGGLGGCPFAPNATGNIATEDLVYMLEGMGVATGVDLDALIGVARWIEGKVGRRLEGMVMKAGPFRPLGAG